MHSKLVRSVVGIPLGLALATAARAGSAADAPPGLPVPAPRYHVPVAEPSLEPYATYLVATARVQIDAHLNVIVGYRLPPEVDGPTQRPIVLNGQLASADAKTVALTGTNASGTCTLAEDGSASCETHYVNLALDLAGARSYIDAWYTNVAAVAGYKAVADELQHQAIGVLMVSQVLHVD